MYVLQRAKYYIYRSSSEYSLGFRIEVEIAPEGPLQDLLPDPKLLGIQLSKMTHSGVT